jgi:hypothetical protein
VITIGIDPHKASHTAVTLDPTGRVVGELRLAATKTTIGRFLRWAERWPDRVWAVEGAASLGHLLAQRLVAREETAAISDGGGTCTRGHRGNLTPSHPPSSIAPSHGRKASRRYARLTQPGFEAN